MAKGLGVPVAYLFTFDTVPVRSKKKVPQATEVIVRNRLLRRNSESHMALA
jgi:adenine/guanine phosphoribosyltransferase-like PRPP-binding protein